MALANIDALNEVTLAILPLRAPTRDELLQALFDMNTSLREIEDRYITLDAMTSDRDKGHPVNKASK